MRRPVLAMIVLSACLIGTACSEETPPEFESGTFASRHRMQIENDCDKRVMCAARTNPYLREDAFEDCVAKNAQNLNAMPDFQLKFLVGLQRCTQPELCSYVQCIDSSFVSFGQMQIDKIDYACQQKAQCGVETQSLAVAPGDYFESCRVLSVVAVDAYTNEQRAAYQTQFYSCMPQISCAFQTCFPY